MFKTSVGSVLAAFIRDVHSVVFTPPIDLVPMGREGGVGRYGNMPIPSGRRKKFKKWKKRNQK